MSFTAFLAQPLRSRLLNQTVYHKRTFSSGIDLGLFRHSSRRSTPFHTPRQHRSGNARLLSKNRFRLTSMMGLVTISDSIKDALYKSEVIPTVIHDEQFTPKGFLMIQYKTSDKEVTMGNTLKVADTQERPVIHFTLNLSDDHKKAPSTSAAASASAAEHSSSEPATAASVSADDRFTLILTDPDAPTRDDDKWSEYCHYVVRDVKLNEFTLAEPETSSTSTSTSTTSPDLDSFGERLTTVDLQGEELLPYVGPGPPPKTGLHRYVFLLYKQQQGRRPEAPPDRPCWGTGVPGSGAAEYAEQYGLELYAVNFFYARNEVQ